MARWVRKDRMIYDFSRCTLCGTAWGGYPERRCPPATCLACGTRQCLGNGLSNGTCAVCLVGLLPGWTGTDRTCGYRGCEQTAVARVGGQVRHACDEHLVRNGKRTCVDQRVAERGRAWVEVEG